LDKADEDALLRYCIVLAAFDIFCERDDEHSILLTPQPKTSSKELLAVAEPHWVDDLRNLSWSFFDNFHVLLDQPATLAPTFHNIDIGGAYGDLIIGRCLIDIKTTVQPFAKLTDGIYQLLGYVLLDSENKYSLQEVAIYFSRQQFLLKWSLDELIADLSGSNILTLNELRWKWRCR
jgi:hypothetical protein